ncbi:hypothetical protein [Natronobeatus ordinarius]|uniref:hypothetical protein n=1 Tax=Natronobeatus ordinarius TaxID=2963433 RepID=UPI0020CD2AE7|nr:hypothetical protein [Natronobeatus ordinarius]
MKLTGAVAATALVAGCGGPGEEDEDLPAEEETGNGQDVDDEEVLSVQRDAVDAETA